MIQRTDPKSTTIKPNTTPPADPITTTPEGSEPKPTNPVVVTKDADTKTQQQ